MKIGLLGLGTVGSGVFEILHERRGHLEKIYGETIEISKVLVKNREKKRGICREGDLLTTNPYEILDDESIDLVVEAIGGIEEAYDYIQYALNKGKHVVTANKAVVAKHIDALLTLAENNHRAFLFEASVGGGIPLIKPLKQCSLINEFTEIKGILNGTSNFILTKMMEEDLDFQEALKIAQELGYAEADPKDDIEGNDVARKLAILTTIAFQNNIRLEDVKYRGISNISRRDIKTFKKMGYSIKLIGKAIVQEKNISVLVEPVLIKNTSQFDKVKNAYNMVLLKGNNVGELRLYGEGAGKKATANAVVCDIIDVITDGCTKNTILREEKFKAAETKFFEGKYYIRVTEMNGDIKQEIDDLLKNKQVSYRIAEKEDFTIVTREIQGDVMEDIVKKLAAYGLSFFYARIEEE
ncbi:homoserine dehydrogenase [Anaerovirgula multivorans]|uniref:Homoserine dehydrogenase n=1 Tax=Anaerovirgula multivorans TaxID=312168 RepID=A0A239D6M1_9FIRM|nr:homoserine dehydrogenase [Anaerovirgula multivorans]SNS27511.1 homoserine dehydrogenase [Anaerovirgula multivorans]